MSTLFEKKVAAGARRARLPEVGAGTGSTRHNFLENGDGLCMMGGANDFRERPP
jgi:hypothetical protein